MNKFIIKAGVQMERAWQSPGPAIPANMHSLISNAENNVCLLHITYRRKEWNAPSPGMHFMHASVIFF